MSVSRQTVGLEFANRQASWEPVICFTTDLLRKHDPKKFTRKYLKLLRDGQLDKAAETMLALQSFLYLTALVSDPRKNHYPMQTYLQQLWYCHKMCSFPSYGEVAAILSLIRDCVRGTALGVGLPERVEDWDNPERLALCEELVYRRIRVEVEDEHESSQEAVAAGGEPSAGPEPGGGSAY